ncbi:MAG TPA: hypothetical protein VL325_00760 [Pyrinomonadaceae bacterium]|nr:hypothetical protein [Pyrinomonadaceae bacterium]
MIELNDFYNDGFGWVCKRCERELQQPEAETHSRLFREGEAESKQPKFSHVALARWADNTRQTLVCPRCGITEPVDKL